MVNVPSRGWYARVTPASGHVHEPSIMVGEGERPGQKPRANSRPSIRLPIPRDEREAYRQMLGDGSAPVDLDVWHDGQRQPIDTLVSVEDTPGYTVLVGEGGRELKQRALASYDQRAVHLAAEDLITSTTSYTANVDAPDTTTTENATLAEWSTTADFLANLGVSSDAPPYEVSGGAVRQRQTCFTMEGEHHDRSSGIVNIEGADYSGDGPSNGFGQAAEIQATGEFVEYDFSVPYNMAGDDFELAVRIESPTAGAGPRLRCTLDRTAWVPVDGTDFGALGWSDFATNLSGSSGYPGTAILAGDHTLRIEAVTTGAQPYRLDVIAPRDGRFTYTDDNTVTDGTDGGRYLSGPELYPDDTPVPFDVVTAPEAVTGARAEATVNGNGSALTQSLSNDQGETFTSGTGTTVETDALGATWGPGVTYKAGLSRFGSRDNGTPTTGFTAQALESLTLKADLEDVPLIVNHTFDGHLAGTLTELAQRGDQLWEYRRTGDAESIEWTTPGQRETGRDPAVADYQATKAGGSVYQRVAVYGKPDVPVYGERFEADHGVAVGLGRDRLQPESERVFDPSTGNTFNRGDDYTMDYQNGSVTALSSGRMDDATVYEIEYRFQAFGAYDDGTADPRATVVSLPGLWTDQACEQAARLIVNEVSSPLRSAIVTVPSAETGWSVVESLAPAVVPLQTTTSTTTTTTDGYGTSYGVSYGSATETTTTETVRQPLHVKRVENTPEATVLTLGSRRSLSDVVADIQAQVSAVSRRT